MARPKNKTSLRDKAYLKFAQKRLRSIHKAVKKARLFEVRKALRRLAAASGQREAEEKLKGQVAALKALSVDGLSNRIAQQFSWPLRWQAGRLVGEQAEGEAGDADGSRGAVPAAERRGGGEGEAAAEEEAQPRAVAAEERVRRTRTVKEVVEATAAEQAHRFAKASMQQDGAGSRAGQQQLEGSSGGDEDGQGGGAGGNGAAASGGRGGKESSSCQAEAKPQEKQGAAAAVGKARNRLGQRARRLLHEQKHGQQAKHKQLEGQKRGRRGGDVELHLSWLAKQRQREQTSGIAIEPGAAPAAARKVVFDDDGAAPPAAGSGGAADGQRAGCAGGGRKAVEAAVLHPSWEARKRAKAMQGMAAPQGKKLVFSDDDDA